MIVSLNALSTYFQTKGVANHEGPERFTKKSDISGDENSRLEGIRPPQTEEDLAGIVINIEYVKANGTSSDRAIEVRSITTATDGSRSLLAFCFVREAIRQFRIDRIKNIYDDDGVVFDAGAFFTSFGIRYDQNLPDPPKPGLVIRRRMRHKACILVALARIDGRYCQSERDAILSYSVQETELRDGPQEDRDVTAFEAYLARLNPRLDTLNRAIDEMDSRLTETGKERFLRKCVHLMNVDGFQHIEEFDFIRKLEDRLTALD
jgi:hypothetical protein